MAKKKTKHVPENCVGVIISFNSLEERDLFLKSDGFQEFNNKATLAAIKSRGKIDLFWNP